MKTRSTLHSKKVARRTVLIATCYRRMFLSMLLSNHSARNMRKWWNSQSRRLRNLLRLLLSLLDHRVMWVDFQCSTCLLLNFDTRVTDENGITRRVDVGVLRFYAILLISIWGGCCIMRWIS